MTFTTTLFAFLVIASLGVIFGVLRKNKIVIGISLALCTVLITIALFLIFVLSTLFITYYSAKKASSGDSFYTAGGGISGLKNGMATAGDYMSAASFLGISALVFANGLFG